MLLIFKTLLRNKGTYFLMTMQIAITLAVLINALALVKRSREIIEEPTGLDTNVIALYVVPFAQEFNDLSFWKSQLKADLEFLRQYPGVIDASVSNSFPGDIGSNNTLRPAGESESGVDVGVFTADERLLNTLDVAITAGRNFTPEEIYFSRWPPADKTLPQLIIVTSATADELFPDENPLQKSVEMNGTTRTVIGVTDTYRGRNPILGNASTNVFIPGYAAGARSPVSLMVRVRPEESARLMKDLPIALLDQNEGRDIEQVRLVSELVARGNGVYVYGGIVLVVISGLLVFTTGLGIFGVAYFSVNKRTKQIGVRRALGATRGDIMKHFFIENLLTTGSGILVGTTIAIALNIVMTQLGLGRVDFLVAGAGIVFVLLIGQVSVLIPAFKASRIEPAIATRT